MSETTELVELPKQETALSVYSVIGGLDPIIDQIRAKVAGTVYNMATAKGRDECRSDAAKVARSKAAIEKMGKALSAEYKEIPKKIDAERKRAFDALEILQKEVRQPLTDWEQAEESRIAGHKDALESIVLTVINAGETAEQIRVALAIVEQIEIGSQWEEFEAEAARAKDKAVTNLRAALAAREKHEAEQAELAKLRAEAEARRIQDEKDRIAREAAVAATKAAEDKARAERDAADKAAADAKAEADRRELDLKLKAETAERERLEAIRKADQDRADSIARAEKEKREAEERQIQAVEAERRRQADEAARIEAEAKAREADRAHKASINGAALAAFMAGGMTEECAKQAITLIVKGQIPAIKIYY